MRFFPWSAGSTAATIEDMPKSVHNQIIDGCQSHTQLLTVTRDNPLVQPGAQIPPAFVSEPIVGAKVLKLGRVSEPVVRTKVLRLGGICHAHHDKQHGVLDATFAAISLPSFIVIAVLLLKFGRGSMWRLGTMLTVAMFGAGALYWSLLP